VSFIVDSSVALAWYFVDETSPYAESVFDRLQVTEAVVPALWPLEMANGFLMAQRRRRLTPAQITRSVQSIGLLPIDLDTEGLRNALGAVLSAALTYGLTAYDASYLELAIRRHLPLATQDEQLRAAAEQAGVELLE
jgi:predicted nucleic acid-binding protein